MQEEEPIERSCKLIWSERIKRKKIEGKNTRAYSRGHYFFWCYTNLNIAFIVPIENLFQGIF